MRLPNFRTLKIHRRYYLRFSWKGTDHKWPAGDTEQDATLLQAEITRAIGAGRFDGTRGSVHAPTTTPKTKRSSLRTAIERYVKYQESRGRAAGGYQSHVNHLMVYFAEGLDRPASAITPRDISDYATDRYTKTCKATGNRYLSTVRRIFALAEQDGLVERSPVRVESEQEPTGRDFYATPEQVESLIEACPDWLRPLVTVAPLLGARKSELLGLTWTNVDFDAGKVWFRRKKNKRKVRTSVPMPAVVRAELKALRKAHPKADYVFLRPDGARITHDMMKDPFNEAVRFSRLYRIEQDENGVDRWDWFRFHDLRHTFASWVLPHVVNLRVLQELMGHADIKTTMRYAHLLPEATDGVADALDRVWQKPGKVHGKVEGGSL